MFHQSCKKPVTQNTTVVCNVMTIINTMMKIAESEMILNSRNANGGQS
jgi:hypothetical protein